VLIEHVKRIKAGDFHAIRWWQQARVGWLERVVVDDGKPADTPCALSWNSLAKPLRHGLRRHLDRDRAYWTPHGCSWWGEMAQPVNWPHVAQKVSSMAVWLIAAFTHVECGACLAPMA
jgi:hypothetical protein